MRTIRILFIVILLAQSIPVKADGFGWYPLLFDYHKFTRDYDTKLRGPLEKLEQESYSDAPIGRYSDWMIVDYLQEHTKEYAVEYPHSYSGDLLAHQTLMFWAKRLKQIFPQSPAVHLLTGRVMVKSDDIRPCAEKGGYLIHGDCRTTVVFSPKEIKRLFWQMTQLLNEQKKRDKRPNVLGSQNLALSNGDWRQLEKIRIYHVLKEAALKNKGVYFYGHD
ncbi:hypothetical protein FLL45_15835 [Aliikangiella marina]|uniref:Uncharacterized protein n=1 Tax=Aliikangiella marina TaxID=1712262 RepID=A0A545T6X5_9GAMM|nr:hypothetical protein [Aliikangiella marina]TQV72935.1 hypothetical protein FLL45_15835 [Aliikangiella marina]